MKEKKMEKFTYREQNFLLHEYSIDGYITESIISDKRNFKSNLNKINKLIKKLIYKKNTDFVIGNLIEIKNEIQERFDLK